MHKEMYVGYSGEENLKR